MLLGKRGMLRYVEAVLAIMILGSILLVMYSNTTRQTGSEKIYTVEENILNQIVEDSHLRNETLYSNKTNVSAALTDFIHTTLPANLNFSLVVCNLTEACPYANGTKEEV